MKIKPITIEVICCLFIILFLYAASSKLLDYQKFVVQIGQSPMLTNMAGFIAWFIPAVEILISIFLILTNTRRFALFAAFSLMTMFTAYIIVITNFTEYVPCSCGGVLEKLGWTQHLVFNIIFILLSIVALWLKDKASQQVELMSSDQILKNNLATLESQAK